MDSKGVLIEAMRQLLKTKNFDTITIQNILDVSGLSRGTFYRYFKDKYEIMILFYKEQIDEIIKLNNSGLDADNKATTREITEFVMNNRSYFLGVLETIGINSFKNFVFGYSKEFYVSVYLKKYSQYNIDTLPQSADFISDFLANGCVSIIDKWVIHDSGIDAETIVNWLYDIMYT